MENQNGKKYVVNNNIRDTTPIAASPQTLFGCHPNAVIFFSSTEDPGQRLGFKRMRDSV
jgi:hypothetical protein